MARGDRIYTRGDRIWCTVKNDHGKWIKQVTPYCVGEEDLAIRFAAARMKAFEQKAARLAPFRTLKIDHVDREPYIPIYVRHQVYAVLLWPQEIPDCIKFGYTTSMRTRFRQHRTLAPDCLLLAYWEVSSPEAEVEMLAALDNSLGGPVKRRGEVYRTDPTAALNLIDGMFGRRLGGATVKTEDATHTDPKLLKLTQALENAARVEDDGRCTMLTDQIMRHLEKQRQ